MQLSEMHRIERLCGANSADHPRALSRRKLQMIEIRFSHDNATVVHM
jgi:hypothetical protein